MAVLVASGCATSALPDPGALESQPDASAAGLDGSTEVALDAGFDAGLPSCALVDSPGPADCQTCRRASCCLTLTNCARNPDCVALFPCLTACTTSACRQGCYAQYPGGVWDFSGLVVCSANNCNAACGQAAPTCGGIGLTTSTCDGCVKQKCCAEATACGRADACAGFIYQCIDKNGCGSTEDTCGLDCRAAWDGGMSAFGALEACTRASCPAECPGL